MPRVAQSKGANILAFFRTATIEVAEFALSQVQDVMRERRKKVVKGKQAAAKVKAHVATPVAAAAVASPAKPKAKKKVAAKAAVAKVKRMRARRTAPVNQPLPDVGADESVEQPVGDEFAEPEPELEPV